MQTIFYDALEIAESIPDVAKAASKIKPFVDMIQTFREKLPYYSIEQLLGEILRTTDYIEQMDCADEIEHQTRVDNIDELINKVVIYQEENEEATLSQFLEEVALVADIDNVDPDADHVMLMTLHAAKGLEFRNVYLAGMEDGLFPGYMSIVDDDPTELEEERRLCYVGITRAMDDLTITCARARMIRGETQYNAVSRFIKEIDPDLLDGKMPASRVRSTDIPSASMTEYGRQIARTKPYASAPTQRHADKKPYIAKAAGLAMQKGSDLMGSGKSLDYAVGDTVSHVKFGRGTVLQITDGGRDYEVTVDFANYGVKKMFASFAKLKKSEK